MSTVLLSYTETPFLTGTTATPDVLIAYFNASLAAWKTLSNSCTELMEALTSTLITKHWNVCLLSDYKLVSW